MAQALPCEWRDKIKAGYLSLSDHWKEVVGLINFDDNPQLNEDGEYYDYAEELKNFDEQGIKIICKRILDKRLRDGKL